MKIIESPVKPPPPTNASPVLTNLILWLLQKDPRLRPSIRDLLKEVIVRQRLREEGLALPEEMLDAETTNFLEQGLPTQLPKDLEEKASVMEDDGTVGLMTTLVDDKDAAHRSFRIAAAALSAQSSSNQMGEAVTAAILPVQRAPSGRFAPPTTEGNHSAPTNAAAPTAVKRTGSTTVSRTNSNVSVGAATAAAPAPTAAVGNRVRGVNRARGNIPSDKARTRYQRPPVPHPSTTAGAQAAQHQQQQQHQHQQQQPQSSSGMLSPSPASFSETVDDIDPQHQLPYGGADEESSMQDGGEDYDDDGDDLDVGGPVGAYEDDLADAKPVPLTHSRRPSERFSSKELDTSSSEPSPMMGDAKMSALSTPEAKKQRPDSKISGGSLNSSANQHQHSNTEDEYESDFVPEEEDDHYDVNAAGKLAIGIGMGGALRVAAVDAKADSKEPAMGTSMTSTTPAPLHSTSSTSLYYNRSMMSTGMSAMHTLNGVGHGDDAELWNSIWTEQRGVVGGSDTSPVGAGLDSHDDMDRFNMKGVTPEVTDNDTATISGNVAESVPMVPIPTQEVTEMLDMARKKAIADLGETLFTKIYSLLSRHMKQDHGATPNEDTESAMNLRMLQVT